jgi:AcrR family transcriptional regulator
MTERQTAPLESRERLLQAADRLFMERGYKAVTLRDIAEAVGIKHASIYHHAPGGKQQLFLEVTERNLAAHQAGLNAALSQQCDLTQALYEAAAWLLAHPPMDLMRMVLSDMVELPEADAHRLGALAQLALLAPFKRALDAAVERGEIKAIDTAVAAGMLLSAIESMHTVPEIAFLLSGEAWFGRTRLDMARYAVDLLMTGLKR